MQLELTADVLSTGNHSLIAYPTTPEEWQPHRAVTKRAIFWRRITERPG